MPENYEPENLDEGEEPVIGDAPPTEKVLFSNKAYDVLKWVAQILLPTLATLYLAIAGLWDAPEPEKVAGTIMAVDAALGLLLGLSTKQYNTMDAAFDGHVVVTPNEAEGNTDARFRIDPTSLETGQKQIRLKVVRER